MKKPRIDMRLVTPREQAKPSIFNETKVSVKPPEIAFRPYRRTVTFSLSEDVLELLRKVKYETGQNYNQIIDNALRRAHGG